MKSQRLELGLLVPQVRNVTVRLLCWKPGSIWQKENEMKNALGQRGSHRSFQAKFLAVAALVLPGEAILAVGSS